MGPDEPLRSPRGARSLQDLAVDPALIVPCVACDLLECLI